MVVLYVMYEVEDATVFVQILVKKLHRLNVIHVVHMGRVHVRTAEHSCTLTTCKMNL